MLGWRTGSRSPVIETETATLRVVSSLSEIARADWDACANPAAVAARRSAARPSVGLPLPTPLRRLRTSPGRRGRFALGIQPLPGPRFSLVAGRIGRRVAQDRVAWPASRPRRSRRQAGGDLPVLPQVPLDGRIRVRPRLGGCLRARRRALLPEAPGLGPVHAGDRPRASSSGPARTPSAGGWRSRPGPRRSPAQLGVSSLHVTFATEDEWEFLGECRLPPPHRPAVPLSQRELSRLRGFPRRARLAETQGDPPRTPRRACRRRRGRAADRQGSDRKRLGRLLRLLHGHRFAEMGPALSQPPLLLADQRAHGGPHPPGSRQARPAATSPGRSTSSAPTRSTAATGARSRSSPSCISSSATTRRSNGRSSTGCRGSKPARRASTSSPAATARRPPIRRTGSPIRPSAARSPTISSASAARSPATARR